MSYVNLSTMGTFHSGKITLSVNIALVQLTFAQYKLKSCANVRIIATCFWWYWDIHIPIKEITLEIIKKLILKFFIEKKKKYEN